MPNPQRDKEVLCSGAEKSININKKGEIANKQTPLSVICTPSSDKKYIQIYQSDRW
jgi:hypothetical protein